MDKIEILSSHNLNCGKFAVVRPSENCTVLRSHRFNPIPRCVTRMNELHTLSIEKNASMEVNNNDNNNEGEARCSSCLAS